MATLEDYKKLAEFLKANDDLNESEFTKNYEIAENYDYLHDAIINGEYVYDEDDNWIGPIPYQLNGEEYNLIDGWQELRIPDTDSFYIIWQFNPRDKHVVAIWGRRDSWDQYVDGAYDVMKMTEKKIVYKDFEKV